MEREVRVDLGCIIDTAMPCAHGATGMREVGGAVERKAGGPCLVRKIQFRGGRTTGGRLLEGSGSVDLRWPQH